MPETRDLDNATMHFLARDPLYETVKPYTLHRSYMTSLPYDNFITDAIEGIAIRDLRQVEEEFSFEENGIAIVDMESALKYEDFEDPIKVEQVYCEEVGKALLDYMQADSVQIFDFAIRRRHPQWPTKPSHEIEGGGRSQPAIQAHLDSTESATRVLIDTLNNQEDPNPICGRFIYLNVWKPLRGPVRDWPLAVCDAQSVNIGKDFMDMDNIMPDSCNVMDLLRPGEGVEINVVENTLVHYSPHQRWYYLSDQETSELLLFRQVDSSGKPGVPHAAFCNPVPGTMPILPRESIEVRAIVYFDV